MEDKKIALYGGTFDPIHPGHVEVSEVAGEKLNVGRVVLIPAKKSPLKPNSPMASDEDRLNMIKIAIARREKLEVSDYELKQEKQKYTIQTVRHFRKVFGGSTRLFWLIGADSVRELTRWYKIEELIDECELCTMYRGGVKRPNYEGFVDEWGRGRVEKMERNIIETPEIDISSTEIREKISKGEDVSEMLLPEVYEYIKERGLYR